MPRRDELYLADVVEACRNVGRFVAELSLDDWLANDLVRYAVLQRLTVMGEAARRLSPDVQGRAASRLPIVTVATLSNSTEKCDCGRNQGGASWADRIL
jgi:uncharacterized protein with HEPN domain